MKRWQWYAIAMLWWFVAGLLICVIVFAQSPSATNDATITQRAGDSDAPARVLFLAGNWDKMSERTAFVLDVNEPGIYRVEVQRFGTGKLTVKVMDVATQRVVSTGKLERER